MRHRLPFSVQNYIEFIGRTCLKMTCNAKTDDHREKRSEFWVSGVVYLIIYIKIIFELAIFEIILGSFGALVSKRPVTRKRLSVEQNSVKFWSLG